MLFGGKPGSRNAFFSSANHMQLQRFRDGVGEEKQIVSFTESLSLFCTLLGIPLKVSFAKGRGRTGIKRLLSKRHVTKKLSCLKSLMP